MAEAITFKVHRVLDGPYEDDEGSYWLNCRVEDADEEDPKMAMFDEEIPFVSFDAAYKFQSHFLTSIEPIVIEFEMETRYDS